MEVSVVIPMFNSESTIESALESVLAQAADILEVIIVDNGSSDESLTKVLNYSSRFPGFVRVEQEVNRGASHARNLGVLAAKGDLIQFVDADDVLLPGKIKRQVDLFTAEVSWVMGAFSVLHREGQVSEVKLVEDTWFGLVFEGGIGHLGSGLFRKKDLIGVGLFKPDLPDGEDLDLYFRLFKQRATIVKDTSSGYLYNDVKTWGRLTKNDPIGIARRQVSFTASVINYLTDHEVSYFKPLQKKYRSALLRSITRQFRVDPSGARINFYQLFPDGLVLSALNQRLLPRYYVLYRIFGYPLTETVLSIISRLNKWMFSGTRNE